VNQANNSEAIRENCRRRLPLLFVVVLLAGTGCNGFSEYEDKMDKAQKRMKYLDEANNLIEPNPLKLPPPRKDDKDPIPKEDVFFRPPKGISTEPKTDMKSVIGGILYPYSSTNPVFKELLFAAVKVENREKFQKDVRQKLGISDQARKELGQQVNRHVALEYYHPDDANPKAPSPHLFFARDDTYQISVAIVFVPSTPAEGAQPGGTSHENQQIDFSLGSLLLGNAAERQHAKWKPPAASLKSRFPRR
jgi:hypothetical protein